MSNDHTRLEVGPDELKELRQELLAICIKRGKPVETIHGMLAVCVATLVGVEGPMQGCESVMDTINQLVKNANISIAYNIRSTAPEVPVDD